jgi:CHAD domain-containing protein
MNKEIGKGSKELLNQEKLIALLERKFICRKLTPACDEIVFYDTFDWRFYTKKLVLSRTGSLFSLRKIGAGAVSTAFYWNRKTPYRFAADHSDPELQALFGKIQDVRAVMAVGELKVENNNCEVLNKDGKIICRINYEKIYSGGELLESVLKILPVKGYDEEAEEIRRILSEAGVELCALPPELLDLALRQQNLKPGSYSSKIRSVLTPDMSPRHAASLLISEMLAVIKANEVGIIENVDTEFLHDFRVSVRRIRALASQLKKVYPEEIMHALKCDFQMLGKMTNRLRDCDVLLNSKSEYKEMLPEMLRDGLKRFFRGITDIRRREINNFSVYLQSDKYHAMISKWRKFIDKDLHSDRDEARNQTIIKVSGKVIMKRLNQIADEIAKINADTPDEFIHALRIDCKKLRYSLEFFASLYPDNAAEPIARLKVIQTLLGDFNDCSVQIDELSGRIRRLPAGKKDNLVAAALGGLVTVLEQRKTALREHCLNKLGDFTGAENYNYFKEMFTPKKGPAQS